MKRKAITAITAAILLMSSTPVFAATSNCSLTLSNLGTFSSASLVESCNNYLTNSKSNVNCSNVKSISSNCSVSDLQSYLKSCGFDVTTAAADTKTATADKTTCSGSDCKAGTTCTGSNCATNTTCSGSNCATAATPSKTTTATTSCNGTTATTPSKTTTATTPSKTTTVTTPSKGTTATTPSTGTTNTTTPTSSSAVAESQYISEVIRLVNVERAKEGLSALTTNSTIQSAAQVRAQEIVSSFSHTRPNGSSCFTALDATGYKYSSAGENIAYGQPTPAAVVDAWMNSPGHRANIMKSSFTTIGVGCYKSGSTYYWSQFFAS